MSDHTDADVDQKVLAMRRSGKSFASIAQAMNLGRPRDANTAFIRAVRQCEPTERTALCDEELGRLQKLEDRVRNDAELAPFDRDRQLDVIRHLRGRLLAP